MTQEQLEQDAARFRFLAERFEVQETSTSKSIIYAFDLSGESWEHLSTIVDRTIKEVKNGQS